MDKLSEMCFAIALKIKLAATSGAKGEKPLQLGVCHFLATHKDCEYYYEIYDVTRYILGDDLYGGGLGPFRVLTQARLALFEKLSSMSAKDLAAIAHRALRPNAIHRHKPIPEFAFLSDLDRVVRVSPSVKA